MFKAFERQLSVAGLISVSAGELSVREFSWETFKNGSENIGDKILLELKLVARVSSEIAET